MTKLLAANGRRFVPLVVYATCASGEDVHVEVRHRDGSPVKMLCEENFGLAISEQGAGAPRIMTVRAFQRFDHGNYKVRLNDPFHWLERSEGNGIVHVCRAFSSNHCIEIGRAAIAIGSTWKTGTATISTDAS